MASHISMTLRSKDNTAISDHMHFRRKDKQIKTKKVKRKIKLKSRHFMISFLFIGGLFIGVQKTYLFMISWDKLNVASVEVHCTREVIKKDIERYLHGKNLGNLLLLDIGTLKESLLSHPWIKDVHMRKTFPSTVNIIVRERIPAALMMCEALYLIDKENVKLQKVDPKHPGPYPLFIDDTHFEYDAQAKLDLAWECLESLTQSKKIEVAVIDLSEYDNAQVKLKNSSMWIIFGNDHFKEKMDFFLARQAVLHQYGSLEYVDLRFKDRLYIRPLENWARNNNFGASKEAD